ncbi:conserved hypothetical protein [Stutzerimonas stutzeri A1501]|uniref:Uncharacterized protein n=3 Tax=Stutzerimonas stutzeri TaxID=316 RepID=A4VIJ9_STUS1|nr:conserved hypothetical protein [Stutzerimonas stutzeri A1501]AKN26016.1 hypothetical protein AB691_1105 [Stutzerimonas stutzeri]EPL63123.1 hypothetical protein B382_06242 [Stutzerimonas stutzeri B1SMN1]
MQTIMRQLISLLRRRPARHFALLDEHGRCRMLLSSACKPAGAAWVEVEEVRLSWIGQPLPAESLRAA